MDFLCLISIQDVMEHSLYKVLVPHYLLITLTGLERLELPEEVSLSSGSYFLVKEEVNRQVNLVFKVRLYP